MLAGPHPGYECLLLPSLYLMRKMVGGEWEALSSTSALVTGIGGYATELCAGGWLGGAGWQVAKLCSGRKNDAWVGCVCVAGVFENAAG